MTVRGGELVPSRRKAAKRRSGAHFTIILDTLELDLPYNISTISWLHPTITN
jgi:hypothetical protein